MLKQASWIHGNSLTVETPRNLSSIVHIGWGTELRFGPGKSSWCHIPIPTPVIIDDRRARLQKLFLFFKCEEVDGDIRNIHIYDGPVAIQRFNGLSLKGNHSERIDSTNTITLQNPREVFHGISISFLFQAVKGIDTSIPAPLLTITSAGGDFF
jgi:hypothetical protein